MDKIQLQEVFDSFDQAFQRKVKVWQINEALSTSYERQRIDFMALKKKGGVKSINK